MDIKGTMTAELCRETSMGSAPPAATPSACVPVRRLAVAPGPSEVTDLLPPLLQVEPASLLTYRIQVFNSIGHSAGKSSVAAYAAAGRAPMPVTGLRGTLSEQGAILEWQSVATPTGVAPDVIDFKRVDLAAPPSTDKKVEQSSMPPFRKGRARPQGKPEDEDKNEAHLRADDAGSGANSVMAGTVDTSVVVGHTYSYAARRVRTVAVGVHSLELQSEPLASVTLSIRDIFPPKTPTGLATISGGATEDSRQSEGKKAPYIDLSWEPNGDADLAGYRVYRQLAGPDGSPRGPLARLSLVPIVVPAYRDLAVKAGQGYIYSVTAVDAAGNESAPSAKALEVLSPETLDPPH